MGQEDPLEAEMVTQSGVLAWIIPWPEEPGRLQSVGSQRVSHDWAPQHPRTGLKRRVNMESWFTGAETLEQTPPGGAGSRGSPSPASAGAGKPELYERLEAPRGQL